MKRGIRHALTYGSLALVPLAALAALSGAGCSRSNTLSAFEGEITMQTTTGGKTQEMKVTTKADKLRFDLVGPGGPTHAVYDPATSKVVFYVDTDKKFMNMDFFMPNASKTPHTDPGSSEISRSGSHKKIAGFTCELVSVSDSEGRRSDVCIAEGIAYFDVNGLRPGLQHEESKLAREYRTHKSFPLESIEFGANGKETSRMVVTKIDKKHIDDSVFAQPADYTRVDLPHPTE